MIEFNTDFIDKSMCDRILSVLKQKKKAKAINIAYALGTDRRTINHEADLCRLLRRHGQYAGNVRGTDRGRYDRGPENGRKGDPEGHPPDPGSFQRGLRGHHMQRPEGRDRRKAPLPLRGMRQKCGAHIRQGHGT